MHESLHLCILVLLFDILFGEAPPVLHYTVWVGKYISFLEKSLYEKKGLRAKLRGFLLVIIVVFSAGTLGVFAENGITQSMTPVYASIVLAMIASMTIALRSLITHLLPILGALVMNRTLTARKHLAMVVGRDTEQLRRAEISRAAVETLAESLGDGIISPLFYFAIFGLPGAFIYRAVNTMDSMLGYKNDKYMAFGWAAARLDDILNYIPVRLCGIFSLTVAAVFFKSPIRAITTAFKYHSCHSSPNAGWMEATAAGALGVYLGGVNYYQGIKHSTPRLNPEGVDPSPRHIVSVLRLVGVAAVIAATQLDIMVILVKVYLLSQYNI